MILVVDSGSTKADWAIISENRETKIISTQGLNPYFHDDEKVKEVLNQQSFKDEVDLTKVKNVFFYGAGCPDEYYRGKMRTSLTNVFNNAQVEVFHDLLGAARAACGTQRAIAGIMGTGSNSCLYDGKNIVDNIPALAHVLGDEGGGVYLGKLILQAYFYRELPKDLLDLFETKYPQGPDAIIHLIYGEGQNMHIASFAEFVIENKEHSFCQKIIETSVRDFAIRHLMKYEGHQQLKINLVGSIACLLQDEVEKTFQSLGLKLGKIVRKPIQALVDYHLETLL